VAWTSLSPVSVGQEGTAAYINALVDNAEYLYDLLNNNWVTYVPTFVQGGAAQAFQTPTEARYTEMGDFVVVRLQLEAAGTGVAGSPIQVSLPVTADTSSGDIGIGTVFDESAVASYRAVCKLASTTRFQFLRADTTAITPIGQDPNFAFDGGGAQDDTCSAFLMYPAA
jgi:hypothetical protein